MIYRLYIIIYSNLLFFKIIFLAGRDSEWLGKSKNHPLRPLGWDTWGTLRPCSAASCLSSECKHPPDGFLGCSGDWLPVTNAHLQYFVNEKRLISEHHQSQSSFPFKLPLPAGEQQSSNNMCSGISPGGCKALH